MRSAILLLLVLTLSACGGLNRAVGVLPNTLDDLAQERERARGETPPRA